MVKFQFSFLQAGNHKIVLYSSIKLTRSNLFCLCFIEKDNWGEGGLTELDLGEVIGNKLILNRPPFFELIPACILIFFQLLYCLPFRGLSLHQHRTKRHWLYIF